jgi:hypothetical protein
MPVQEVRKISVPTLAVDDIASVAAARGADMEPNREKRQLDQDMATLHSINEPAVGRPALVLRPELMPFPQDVGTGFSLEG